jgi:hypothetical protein
MAAAPTSRQPIQQPAHRCLIVGDPIDIQALATRQQRTHHDRVLRDVEPEMDQTINLRHAIHGDRLLPVWLHPPTVDDLRDQLTPARAGPWPHHLRAGLGIP